MANTIQERRKKTLSLVQLSILIAIILIMAFTPLGYLKIGAVSITFLTLPVSIGAIIGGVGYGAILGAAFGLTSFMQCFGLDAFGTMLMGINPVLTFIMCMLPRIAMGILVALIFKALQNADKKQILSYSIANLSGAVLNTIFFVSLLVLFFGTDTGVLTALGSDSILGIIGVLITFNAAIEAVVCLILGTAVSRVLMHFIKKDTK
jgi:uncharacterized membrane protein